MRELMLCLEANKKKFYHLGFGTTVTRRNFGVDGNVYAFDSSTIDLCLSIFWWAKFRENKGGIKLHTLFDVKTSIPVLVVDKGYIDFGRLHDIHQNGSFFVTRAKDNMKFKRMYSRQVDKTTGVLCDQIGKLVTPKSLKLYPDKIRRIKYYDAELDREFVFITNNMELDAKEIAMLYKNRWHVELFFYDKLLIMSTSGSSSILG